MLNTPPLDLSPDKKIAGVLAPVFALRGPHDLGVGDVAALRALADWASVTGLKLIQILPINETGGDHSPYNAISSVALDVTTLELHPSALPDLSGAAYRAVLAEFDLTLLTTGPVDYVQTKDLKHQLLARAFQTFLRKEDKPGTARTREFADFVEKQKDWLIDYALFRVLLERNGSEMWTGWPAEHATPADARVWLDSLSARKREKFLRRIRYYQYVQWIAYSQWQALHLYCTGKGVALMGDVPFGVNYFSADVWADRPSFDLTWSGGAPPEKIFKTDPFTEKWGQNWGIPLYNWPVMIADDFRWWRQRVRMVRALLDLFRIDHVLGCYRIYSFPWRPADNALYLDLNEAEAAAKTGGPLPGFKPRDDSNDANKEASRAEGERLLKVLLEETGDHRLIGEDLGVVPDYVRPNLQSLGIAGFKIPQWEREWHGEFIPGAHYERLSLVTYATHDHEPLRSMWDTWQANISSNHHEADSSRTEMHRLMRYAGLDTNHGWPDYSDDIQWALLGAILRSNSWQAVTMITDYFGLTTRFNVPGAISNANWSNRIVQPVAKWLNDPVLCPKSRKLAEIIRETGR